MDAKIVNTKITIDKILEAIEVYITSQTLLGEIFRLDVSKSVVLLYKENKHPYKIGCKIERSYGIPSICLNTQQHVEIEKWITQNENKYIRSRYTASRNNVSIEFFLMEDFERFMYEVMIAKNI